MGDTCPPWRCLFRPAPSSLSNIPIKFPLHATPFQSPIKLSPLYHLSYLQSVYTSSQSLHCSSTILNSLFLGTQSTACVKASSWVGAMAATKGTSLIRLLHRSAVAQAARYQPAGELSAPVFGTSPGQSILRRFFADGTQTIDRAKVEAGETAQKGKEFAEEKTEQASQAAGEAKESAKETASSAADKAKETKDTVAAKADSAADQAKEQGESVVEKVKEGASKELNTASDMVKDVPGKTKETAQNLKEVGIEAAKAVKRDASRLAEKVGLKTPSE